MSSQQQAQLLWPWIERTFRFHFPVGKLSDPLKRWRGTPARLDHVLRNVSHNALTWAASEHCSTNSPARIFCRSTAK